MNHLLRAAQGVILLGLLLIFLGATPTTPVSRDTWSPATPEETLSRLIDERIEQDIRAEMKRGR